MKRSLYLLILISFFALSPNILLAQDMDYLEDEGSSLWESDSFVDPGSANFDAGPGGASQSSEYVGEDEVQALENAAKTQRSSNFDAAALMDSSKEGLPGNVKYGALTGVALGGWLAMQTVDITSAQRAQYIGTGAVLGVLLGMAVGTQAAFQASNDPHPQQPLFDPREEIKPTAAFARVGWKFQF